MKNAIPVLRTEYEQLMQGLAANYPIIHIGMYAYIKNWFDTRFKDEEEKDASTRLDNRPG